MSKFGGSVDGDEVDQAAVLQDSFNQQGIQRCAQQNGPETHPNFNGADCVDCGDPLPNARLLWRKVRCTSCQTALEKIKRHLR